MIGILLDNAIEASSKGDNIYVDIAYKNNKFVFDVKNPFDNVTDDFKRKIFKKGYSTKKKNGINQGNGLYIAKAIINYYNRDIDVESISIDNKPYVSFKIFI